MVTKINFKEIDEVNALTDRVTKRKNEYLEAEPHVCSERSRLVTESWKETEGDPFVIRKAKQLRKILENQPIVIRDGELIVGSQTPYVRGASPATESDPYLVFDLFSQKRITSEGVIDQGKITSAGEVEESIVSDESRTNLLEDAEYWRGKSTMDQVRYMLAELGEQFDDFIESRVVEPVWQVYGQGGCVTPKSVEQGLKGIIAEAKERRQNLTFVKEPDLDYHRCNVYQAMIIGCEAVITFAERHAKLAAEMAQKEADATRKRELEELSRICLRVPANPPESFHEALQSVWLIHLCNNLEVALGGQTIGRVDQYLYPYYAKDIETGKITPQKAAELIALFYIKLMEAEDVRSVSQKNQMPMSMFQCITLGGVTTDGKDAANDLSFLMLEVMGQIKMPQPAIHLAWHLGINSDDLLNKAAKTVQATKSGIPTFINDKLSIRNYTRRGVSLDDARKWAALGCTSICIPHLSGGTLVSTIIVAKILELTLNNGVDPRTGKQIGLATGNPRDFSSFEELYQAFEKQLDYCLSITNRLFASTAAAAKCGVYTAPFGSALKDDCMEKGLVLNECKPRYPFLAAVALDRGCTDTADSLTAIKELVFDEKKLTMTEMLDALSNNFEGREDIRQMCLEATKYGNDDDAADEMFGRVSLMVARKGNELTNPQGGTVMVDRPAGAGHYHAGLRIGALPNGRKAWEPLNDAALSAMGGADIQGPTALINSATKARHTDYVDALVLNMKFAPTVLSTESGIKSFTSLIKTFFERGGWLVQFNVVSRETLEEAQRHPEQYQTLMVRVGGFSAYFVDLSPQIQDEIIRRTELAF